MNTIPSAIYFCYRETRYSNYKDVIEQTNEYLAKKDYRFIDVFWKPFVDYKTHQNVDQLKQSLFPIHEKLTFINELISYVTIETDKIIKEEQKFSSQNTIKKELDLEINDFKQTPTAQKAISLQVKLSLLLESDYTDLMTKSLDVDREAFFSYIYNSIQESNRFFYSIIDEYNVLKNDIYEFDGHAFTPLSFVGKGRFKNKPDQLFCRKKRNIPDNSNVINLGSISCVKCFERFATQLFE